MPERVDGEAGSAQRAREVAARVATYVADCAVERSGERRMRGNEQQQNAAGAQAIVQRT